MFEILRYISHNPKQAPVAAAAATIAKKGKMYKKYKRI